MGKLLPKHAARLEVHQDAGFVENPPDFFISENSIVYIFARKKEMVLKRINKRSM